MRKEKLTYPHETLQAGHRLALWGCVLTTLLMAAACSSDDGPETSGDELVPVSFSADVPVLETRSVINDNADLQGVGFGVFAYYTGSSAWASVETTATPNFMYNQEVTYGDAWTYTPVKYWPNDNRPADDENPAAQGSQAHSYVSFFAYAPYNGTGLTLSDNTATDAPTIDYTWAIGNDLLYAEPVTDCYKQMPEGYGTTTGHVPFNFKHALAMVEFKVRRKEASGSDITLKELNINFDGNTSGTFNLGSCEWTSTSDNASNDDLFSFSGTSLITGSTDADAHTIGSSLMMPGSVTFTYSIKYDVSSTNYTNGGNLPMTLVMNKKYTIMFIIDGDNVESYVLRERKAEQW